MPLHQPQQLKGTQTAQLTIFYAGTVNVFNDITQEKAHLIMLLAANGGGGGTSWTSAALAKFISSQGSSSIMSAPSSLMNAVTAETPVQTITTPPAANPPPASSSVVSTTSTFAAACAPNVAPPMLLPSAPQNSAAKLQQQQEYSSLSQLPVLLNMRDTTSLTIVPLSALLPPPAPQGQNISSQGTIVSQKQAASLLPELSRVMTAALNVKGERSGAFISLANALSMQPEENNMGLSAKKGNESQLELLQEAASNPSSCAPAASLNAAMRGSSVCYTQELPHARKTSLVRFLDMRQKQKRARTTRSSSSSQQNGLIISKMSVDHSPPPLPSDSVLTGLQN
jgi:hypothetical protein